MHCCRDGVFRVMSSVSSLPHLTRAPSFPCLLCPLHGLCQMGFYFPLLYEAQCPVWSAGLIVVLSTDSFTCAVNLCISSRVALSLLVASLINAVLPQPVLCPLS
ncbi:hypothetical protein ATANTOWER_005562 [Ataeniobius toweri]|uniref:Uncharacterized protein n=1 Tax=Ataeniobius toweri TaxID=208326 RepID=A0ABU7A4S3_9TELE|nr:hypothetical protein [Ataeniobius toweri]